MEHLLLISDEAPAEKVSAKAKLDIAVDDE